MIDLSTSYLGMRLKNPLVPSASPISGQLDSARRLEDHGAAAVVMDSLFEEEILHDQHELHWHTEMGTESFAESLTYLPEHPAYEMHGEDYLERLVDLKRGLSIPVIASLNGCSEGGWLQYAEMLEQAGADALELNIYFLATNPEETPAAVEQRYVDIVRSVRQSIQIPLAVKVGPFFTSFAHTAKRLQEAGADALVLFNRFYEPDIDLDTMEVRPHVLLSTPQAMRLPLRWIAILRDQLDVDLAATSGVHGVEDVIKMLAVGADVTQMASVLLRKGPEHLGTLLEGLKFWLQENEYTAVEQLKGSMSYRKASRPDEFERANYIRALKDYA